MGNNLQDSPGGLGFMHALVLLLIWLKLTGYLQMSWVLILSPLWIPFELLRLIATVGGIIYLVTWWSNV